MKTFEAEPDEPDLDRVLVGVSEYRIADSGETLIAYGLGACIGVVLYDPAASVGGLAHTLLPRRGDATGPDGKFVDTAVEAMLGEMIGTGASYGDVEARLVGGADIFDLEALAGGVGDRNVAVAREELDALDIPVVGDAVGGDHGRTVEFDVGSGDVRVITADDSEPTLL